MRPLPGDLIQTNDGIFRVTDSAEFDDLVRVVTVDDTEDKGSWIYRNEIVINFTEEKRADDGEK